MKDLDRLLDAWVGLSAESRRAIVVVADALLAKHSLYPTVSVEHPTRVVESMQGDSVRKCMGCGTEIVNDSYNFCAECGWMIAK